MTGVTFLDRVCAEAIERVAAAERIEPLDALRDRAWATPSPPAFAAALADGGIIAEVKRASPSRGVIAENRDAAMQARAYVDGGAAAVSVLTEPAHFGGSLDDLAAVAGAVDAPVLRKDFILTGYQLFEARAAGAAAALLLVGALDDARLAELLDTARDAGIDVLIETHDAEEIARASVVLAGVERDHPWVVGVNARDLTRLSVDRNRFAALAGMLPENVVVVAESGVSGPDDVEDYRRVGADAVLVGEHLMVADDPMTATRTLVEAVRRSPAIATLSHPI
ncbi:MAG: indole-3-glycerol phosphate synthase TrpC [Actinobacteria bacterium]|nr:indole-3-glycerol phosphate synthase TrpC [Actinomycetota bacterium]